MSFIIQNYNTAFINSAPPNLAARTLNAQQNYGVRITAADVAEGETYWKVIGVHHLLPEENQGNHHVYLEALDENGRRFQNPPAWAGWTWQGRRPNERADPVSLDKPASEAGANIALFDGQIASVWIKGLNRDAQDKSDRVENLDIIHPDEPGPHGEKWNSIGHHSFYVVFQRTRKGPAPTTPIAQPMNNQVAVSRGVVSGQIVNGRGYKVRLWQGNTLAAEQMVDNNGVFKFEGVLAGIYRLEAIGPTLRYDNINIDANHLQVTVNLAPV